MSTRSPRRLVLATRRSQLALIQSEIVARALRARFVGIEVQLLPLVTAGDQNPNLPLAGRDGKGLFTRDLESALLSGEADIAVHSLKDLPTELSEGLLLAATVERADPRDGLVGCRLDDLGSGAVVGTDSPRRSRQLGRLRPSARFESIRGNVQTRMQKVEQGEYAAAVLAVCGLQRMGLASYIKQVLEPSECLSAPGQGAIALETSSDGPAADLAAAVNHEATWLAVRAERAFSRSFGFGCALPVGALAEVSHDQLHLWGLVAGDQRLIRMDAEGSVVDPEAVGSLLAERVLAAGGTDLLR